MPKQSKKQQVELFESAIKEFNTVAHSVYDSHAFSSGYLASFTAGMFEYLPPAMREHYLRVIEIGVRDLQLKELKQNLKKVA